MNFFNVFQYIWSINQKKEEDVFLLQNIIQNYTSLFTKLCILFKPSLMLSIEVA